MNYKQFLAAATCVGAAVTSPAALASTIQATYTSAANFGNGAVGYDTGYLAPNPNSPTSGVNIYIGGDSFTSSNTSYGFSSTGQFNAWCVDIYHWMANSYNYTVGTPGDLAAMLSSLRPGADTGTTRVNQLIQLANEVYGSLSSLTDSAAFQLAVWEITYGTPGSNGIYQINSSDVGFNVGSNTAGAAIVEANGWLTNLNTAAITGNYRLTFLNDGTDAATQDVVVFSRAIPEPASLALLGLGFAGLVSVRRKPA